MARIELIGVTPNVLMHYLKGLGVLRLVHQVDHEVSAHWNATVMQLETSLNREDLVHLFLEQYAPTPIVSPWNKGSGFWDSKTAGRALQQIERSTSARLTPYRQTITAARRCIDQLHCTAGSLGDKKQKASLLVALRAQLPDAALDWLDTAVVVTDVAQFSPLLGTGGNDGRLDFSSNFHQHLARLMPFSDAASDEAKSIQAKSRAWLESSLWQVGSPALVTASSGQFHPGGIGGPNAISGFEGDFLVNPWDFVLMLEGVMLLAGSATRRLGSSRLARAAFPFTVSMSAAGSGTLSNIESTTARAEIWLPIWSNPVGPEELRRLFGEGRAQIGRRDAQSGIDFARAVVGLGTDRGVDAFHRFAFVQRSGLNYLATSLGALAVHDTPTIHLVDETDEWLQSLRRVATGDAPMSLRRAVRRIEDAVFTYCETRSPSDLLAVLAALGRAERLVAVNHPRSMEGQRDPIRPLQGLSMDWMRACHNTAEVRLAAAIASIWHPGVGAIRCQLEPVEQEHDRYKWGHHNISAAPGTENLSRLLSWLLERRLILSKRQLEMGGPARDAGAHPKDQNALPIDGALKASLADIHRFLRGETNDALLLDLIFALAMLSWPPKKRAMKGIRLAPSIRIAPELSRAYCLLKLLFLPKGIPITPDDPVSVRPEPALLHLLRAGRLHEATAVASRRLVSSGLRPLGSGHGRLGPLFPPISPREGERLAAALLIPISDPEWLIRQTLVEPDRKDD